MSFYKINTPAAIAAWDVMHQADAELRKQGTAFAELFGARPVFKNDVTSTSFHGIRFHGTTYVSASLWTQPTSNNGYCSWPKAKAPRGMSASHKALMELWNGCRPKQSVDVSAFYPAIGLDWGILFMTGFAMFRHADTIYIETGAKPKADAGAVEILGSECRGCPDCPSATSTGLKSGDITNESARQELEYLDELEGVQHG